MSMGCCCGRGKGHYAGRKPNVPVSICSSKVHTVSVNFPYDATGYALGTGKLKVVLNRADFTSLPDKWFSAPQNEILVRAFADSSLSGLVITDKKDEWVFTDETVTLVAEFKSKGSYSWYRRIYEILSSLWNAHSVWGTYPSPTTEQIATREKFLTRHGLNEIKTFVLLADGSVHNCTISFGLDFQSVSVPPSTSGPTIDPTGGGGTGGGGTGGGGTGGTGGGGGSCLTVNLHTWREDGVDEEGNPRYRPVTISKGFLGWVDYDRYRFKEPEAMAFVGRVNLTSNEKINSTRKPVDGKYLAYSDSRVRGGWRIESVRGAQADGIPDTFVSIVVNQACIRSALTYSGILGGGSVIYHFRRVSRALEYNKDNNLSVSGREYAFSFIRPEGSTSDAWFQIGDSPNYADWKIAQSENDANSSRLWGGMTYFKYDFEWGMKNPETWSGYYKTKVED